jgi:NDP-sugar pyrophosphorylase family protein
MVKRLQGAIIAAGRGERLRNSTRDDIPKPLVKLGDEAMLSRQARALLDAGASSVVAVINSATARIAGELSLELPESVRLVVRDTPNSMETMLALGEVLEPGWFLASTVDAVIPQAELARFVNEARRKIEECREKNLAGVLAVAGWHGEAKPLFADVTSNGLILRLGDGHTSRVTAGIYFLSTRVFDYAADARSAGLDALRRFLALLIARGMRLDAIEIEGSIDVDEASDLEAARAAIRKTP